MLISEIKLAKELIRCPSVTPIDAGAINLLAKKLRSLGFKCQMMNFKNIKNLYARLGKSSPNFCFAGHTDVVPVGDLKSWSTNPFSGVVKNNKLIGRGASDMKGSIACFIAALSQFKKVRPKFKGSISLLITGDEETIAINGTKKVIEKLKKRKEKINFCLVGEPTNLTKLGQIMKIGRRGSITGYLTVYGTQGHVAYPYQANNPASIITKILNQINNMKLDNGTKNFQPSNLEVVKINIENSADNVIPAEATATFNIRFNNKHSSTSLKKKLNKVFHNVCRKNDCSFKISYMISGEAFFTTPNKTTYMIQKIIKKITKIKPKLSTTGGTSDARFIRKISPCVEFGLVGKTAHKVDEMVLVSDMKKLKKIYLNILQNYFSC
ncbi:MAG: succinyl-diaminopimelate desuccinylase [Pelagibacteraceae bacterium]|jgi:succinyl-diaminopimelate desuccinylase|nr:succinyl-diaminopimelate desuccinylase [Pelagibacteraceae bacterium]|tara:strand:- start:4735 stop:5877 length:1143 start_codon:yes stop_codon:yes gene_type:complete